MFWDDLIRRWRRENGSLGPRLLRGAAGHVAVLPAPRRRRRATFRLLIVVLGVLLVLLVATGRVHAAATGPGPQSDVAVSATAGTPQRH